ncbi:hypothetical protein [Pseudomonas sp. EA_35y_Pfl2_R111]|uniref:hypothetical protein n=1 Tax=Pseudomonas sp. EA_35y_Pfl2_R111 TaxID=3088689 RepID=UPI0030DA1830
MQPFKTLLVALMLGGSAVALAADNSQSVTVESLSVHAPLYAQSWPAIREVDGAWPQWMRNLTGTVLALNEGHSQVGICSEQRCVQSAGLARLTASGTYQQTTQQSYASPQLRPASVQWQASPDVPMPQRLSF